MLENVSPYKVGSHQHVAEIAQLLGFPVSFTPHLLPVRRGLLATCNVRSTGADLRALLEERYAASPVVTVLPEGVAPELARVQHTDGAEIGVFDDRHTDRTIVICAIDNLGKGAAGQAVQNVNALFGLAADGGTPPRRCARLMSVTAAEGFVASGVGAGHQAVREARRRARPLACRPPSDARCGRSTASRLHPSWSRGVTSSSRSRRPWS